MLDVRLFLAQRICAMLMAPLVLGHLGMMIYAIQGGLSAGEILSRTQGSFWWAAFYGLFVIAVSIHAAIGIRVVVYENFKLSTSALNVMSWLIATLLLTLGLHSVTALVS